MGRKTIRGRNTKTEIGIDVKRITTQVDVAQRHNAKYRKL